MTIVASVLAFNSDNLDLNRLARYSVRSNFLDNGDIEIEGRIYPDLYDVSWTFNNVIYESVFGGVDLSPDPIQFEGTVTGYLELYLTSFSGWITGLTIEDISIPANSIYQAALTP